MKNVGKEKERKIQKKKERNKIRKQSEENKK